MLSFLKTCLIVEMTASICFGAQKPKLTISDVKCTANSTFASAKISLNNPTTKPIRTINPIELNKDRGAGRYDLTNGVERVVFYAMAIGPNCKIADAESEAISGSSQYNTGYGIGSSASASRFNIWNILPSEILNIPKLSKVSVGSYTIKPRLVFCPDSAYKFIAEFEIINDSISNDSYDKLAKFLDSVESGKRRMHYFGKYKSLLPDAPFHLFKHPNEESLKEYLDAVKLTRGIQNWFLKSDTFVVKRCAEDANNSSK